MAATDRRLESNESNRTLIIIVAIAAAVVIAVVFGFLMWAVSSGPSGEVALQGAFRAGSPEFEKKFRANKPAWEFFQSEPPSIRRVCIFWVMGAKKEETRVRRLEQLIDSASKGLRRGVMETRESKAK